MVDFQEIYGMQFTIIRKFLVSKLIVLSIVMLMWWYDTSSDEIFNSLLEYRTNAVKRLGISIE